MTNKITGVVRGHQYPDLSHNSMLSFGNNEARDITGLSTAQLTKLYTHLRIPDRLSYQHRYVFAGEEAFLHYIICNRLGETKIKMSWNYSGEDPRRFTYSIQLITDHIYINFYHRISGDSMREWVPHIPSFGHSIWSRIITKILLMPGILLFYQIKP